MVGPNSEGYVTGFLCAQCLMVDCIKGFMERNNNKTNNALGGDNKRWLKSFICTQAGCGLWPWSSNDKHRLRVKLDDGVPSEMPASAVRLVK